MPFERRSRQELLEIISALADRFQHAAAEYKRDAVIQIEDVEHGRLSDMNEAIHRAVHAVAFMKLEQQLRELLSIAEGRRDPPRLVVCPISNDR